MNLKHAVSSASSLKTPSEAHLSRLLISAEISFRAVSSREAWRPFLEISKIPVREIADKNKNRWDASFVVLPKNLTRDRYFLTGMVHPMTGNPEETHWILKMEPIPSSPPPSDVKQFSDALGGLEAFSEIFWKNWNAKEKGFSDTKASFVVPSSKWLPPRDKADSKKSLGKHPFSMTQELIQWRVEKKSGLLSLAHTFPDSKGNWLLMVNGRHKFKFGADWFVKVEEKLWEQTEDLLCQVSER